MCRKTKINLFVLILTAFLLLQLTSAQAPLTKDSPYNFTMTCEYHGALTDSASARMTVQNPDGSYLFINQTTTNIGGGEYYKTATPTQLGTYIKTGECCQAGECFSGSEEVETTGNGRPNPSGGVIVLFSICFLVIMGFLVYELIVSLGHFVSLDLDVIDLAKSMGLYFALFALYQFGKFYLGNLDFNNWLLLLIRVGGFTHILIPIIGFTISITVGSLRKKQVDFGVQRIYRRQGNVKI